MSFELGEDFLKLIFQGSLSLTAMLVAVVGFLLAQYASLMDAPSYMSRPYRRLSVTMVIVLIISATTSLLSFFKLLGVLEFISSAVSYTIVILHVTSVVSLIVGVAVTGVWTLRQRRNK